MSECNCLATCIFFNKQMAHLPNDVDEIKKKYCKGNYASCARYIICEALGRAEIPEDLFPFQEVTAKVFIQAKKNSAKK